MKRSSLYVSAAGVISAAIMVFLASGAPGAMGSEPEIASPFGDRSEVLDLDNAYNPPMVYADAVDITESSNGHVKGTFTLINDTEETVSDIGYRIEVFGDPLEMEGSSDPQVLYGRMQPNDVFALVSKEKKTVSFDLTLPTLPKGAYTAQVQVLQTGGRKLGWGRAPLVVAKGAADFVYFYEQSIVLPEFENKEVHPLTGPNVDPSGALVFTAKVEHAGAGVRTLTPVLEWHEFDESRPVADTVSFDAVRVAAGELSLLTLPVKAPAKPGVYVGMVTLRENGRVISTLGEYRIVVRGASADLISARLAAVATKKGETAFARIDYVGSADAETRGEGQLTVELRDADGVAGTLFVPSIRLTDGVGRGTARIELTRDLTSEPNIHVVIADAQGNTLRDASVPVVLSSEQLATIATQPTWQLWATWYAQPYYLMWAFIILSLMIVAGFVATAAMRNIISIRHSFRAVSAAVMVGVLLFMQSPFAMAFGGSNGIEVFAPITVGENENQTQTNKDQYRAYWSEIYNQPAVALFVNRPVHNGTYQCNTPIPLEYRVDFAACNNMPSGGRVLAHFDLNQNFQNTLLGTGANWVKVYDQTYNQPASCGSKACIHSYSQNTTINLNAYGLPTTATKTTLRVVVKHNPYLDGNTPSPDDTVSYSDFYFQWRVAQAFNIWLNFVCAQPKADIQIVKTAVTPSVNQGNQASYAITVRNNGPDTANNVVVTDQIPNGLTFVSASDNRCSQVGSSIVCNFGNMANGAQIPATFTFQTSGATVCGNVPNVARVSTTTQDDNQSNNESSATVQVNCPVVNGCIDIIKEALDFNSNLLSVVPQFTFTLDGNQTVVNDSTGRVRINNVTPGNHTVTEMLPAGWELLQTTPSNGVVNVQSGSQCAGISFKNRQVLPPTLDLTILKSGPATITRGNTIFYTVAVTNSGPATASNVVVTDQVPNGLNYLPGSSDASCSLNSGTVTCNLGTMAPGTRSITLAFAVPEIQNCSQTTIPNTARVSTSSQETNTGNNQSTVTTVVNCPPPQTGCIDVKKEVYDVSGNLLPVVPQFTFALDGNQTVVNDSNGNARFSNVPAGNHTVTETLSSGWTQLLVTPVNGVVTVQAGAQCVTVTFKNRQVIQPNPDVSVMKAGPSVITRGNIITYTLTVFNSGNAPANNVVITDHTPAGLTFVPSSSDPSCSLQSASVVCNLGTVNSSDSRAVLLSFSVPSTQPCTTIQNQASITSSNDSNTANNTSGMVTTQVNGCSSSSSSSSAPVQTGCIEIIKTTLNTVGNVLTPVTQFTYTLDGNLTTQNDSTGRARFNNVSTGTHTVAEVVPSGWTMTSMSPVGGTVNVLASSGNVSCAQVYILNQQNSVAVNADLAIVKTGPSTALRGSTFNYQLNVTNNGPQSANNVIVTDQLPSELTYLPGSSDSRCTVSGQTVSCQLGTMTSGQQTTITLAVQSNTVSGTCSQTTITNRATVTSSTPDSNQGNNSSQMTTTLTCPNVQTFCPDVSIDTDDDEVDAGDEIDYEIRVRNNTSQSQTFDLTAFLDRDMEFVDASSGGDDDDDEVTWDNVSIAANSSKTFKLTVETDNDLNDGDSVRLRVETDCDSDSEETDIRGERIALGEANLTIDKSVDRNEALPGDVLSYTLTVRNSGSASISNVVVDDVHTSSRLTIFSAPGGTISGNSIHWELGTMARGAVRILHYTASVSLDAQNGDLIPNTATVTAPGQRASDSEFVHVLRILPQTGAFNGTLTPVTLKPILGNQSSGNTLPFMASFLVAILGTAGGAFASKKYML